MNTSVLEQIRGGFSLRRTPVPAPPSRSASRTSSIASAQSKDRSNTAMSGASANDFDPDRKNLIRIFFNDGTYKIFHVTQTTTVNELGQNIFRKMKYPETEDFSMTMLENGKSMSLSKSDVVFQLMVDWDEEALRNGGSDNYRITFTKFKIATPQAKGVPTSAPPRLDPVQSQASKAPAAPLVPNFIPTVPTVPTVPAAAPPSVPKESAPTSASTSTPTSTPAYSYAEKKAPSESKVSFAEPEEKPVEAPSKPSRYANARMTYGDKELTAMLAELGLAAGLEGAEEDDLLADAAVDFQTLNEKDKRKHLRKSLKLSDDAALDDLMSKLYMMGNK